MQTIAFPDVVRVSALLAGLLLPFASLHCTSAAPPVEASSSDAADADARVDTLVTSAPETDPNCHWDCFGGVLCHDGGVTRLAGFPVPCEHWTGSCPVVETYECQRGCRVDGVVLARGDGVENACEEYRPKRAGDRCATRVDCLTAANPDAGPDAAVDASLECDAEAGVCVPAGA